MNARQRQRKQERRQSRLQADSWDGGSAMSRLREIFHRKRNHKERREERTFTMG